MNPLTLKRHNLFEIKITHAFAPKPLILKMQ